jgi:hypothetical protein
MSDGVSKKIDLLINKLGSVGATVKKQSEYANSESQKQADKLRAIHEKAEANRIRMQRASVALEERMEKQRATIQEQSSRATLKTTENRIAVAARLERKAAIEEAALTIDRFDRRIAIEKARHAQILADVKTNDLAIEAENRRHAAVVSRIEMDKANFPNTPFQKMLENFNKLNGSLGKWAPAMTTVASSSGLAASAVMGFGGALGSLTMGPVGAAIIGITAVSAALNKLIGDAEAAANLRAGMGEGVKDPAKVKELLAIQERYEKAKAMSSVPMNAGMGVYIDLRAQAMQKESAAWKKATGVRIEDEKIWDAARLKSQLKAAEKTTDQRKQEIKDAKTEQEERWAWDRDVREVNQRNEEKVLKYKEGKAAKAAEVAKRNAEDEARAQAIYDRRKQEKDERESKYKGGLRMAQAGEDPLAQLKVRHETELEEARKQGDDLSAIELRQQIERTNVEKSESDKRIEQTRKEREAKLAATSTLFGGLAALAAQANMKDRAARMRWKTLAAAEAIANTSLAATKALTSGVPPWNFIAMAGVIASGMAQVNAIKEQKFATGTDFAPGGEALVGERGPEKVYLPRGAKVKTAAETRQIASQRTFAPVINIQLSGAATRADAQRVAEAVGDSLRQFKRQERDADYLGVRA